MSDWEVTLDSDNLKESPPDKAGRFRRRRRWLWVTGIFLMLLAVSAVGLYWQRADRRAAMREDLKAVIFAEEAARFLGQPDQATLFMLPTAPPAWQQAYRQTFERDGKPPTAVQINEIDFDGRCAMLTVQLDQHQQVRAYCLSNQQWRRGPVRPWSGEETVIDLTNQSELKFLPPDQAFATELAADLPQLLKKVEQLAAQAPQEASVSTTPPEPVEIVIEPHDQHGPLIWADGDTVILNSPWLVPFTGNGTPSGTAAVRLALTTALFNRAGVRVSAQNEALPGAERFLTAAHTVIAADLALPPQTRAELFATWRTRFEGPWISPFFGPLLAPDDPDAERQARLAARLTAEYIYRTGGRYALLVVMKRLPEAKTWDALFETNLNRSTVALEKEVAADLNRSAIKSSSLLETEAVADLLNRPLQASLVRVVEQGPDDRHLLAQPNGRPGGSVMVELSSDSFQTPGGTPISSGCLVPGSNLEIEGDWLERQQRLQASRIIVQESTPLNIEPAPADTIAYLVEGERPAEPELAAAHVFPSNRSFFIGDELLWPRSLRALRQDGTIQPLTPLSQTLRVVPLPVTATNKPHFLFILDLPQCERDWFVHYEPDKGVTGSWLGLPQPMRWIWRADQNDLLFFESRSDLPGHNIYVASTLAPEKPVSQTSTPVSFAGWNQNVDQLVFIRRAWVGATGIGFLDPASGAMRRARLYVQPLRARRLSPNGQWVAYLTGVRNRLDPPYRLDLLNLENLAETTLIEVEQDQRLGPAVWSLHLDQTRLAALAGSLAEDGTLHPTRLLIASPEQPGDYLVVAEATGGDQLASPVFCGDGSLLYRVKQGDQYLLKRQQPGRPAEHMLTRAEPFLPIVCP